MQQRTAGDGVHGHQKLVPQERVLPRNCQHIINIHIPQNQEDEEDVPKPQVVEHSVAVPWTLSHDRIQQLRRLFARRLLARLAAEEEESSSESEKDEFGDEVEGDEAEEEEALYRPLRTLPLPAQAPLRLLHGQTV